MRRCYFSRCPTNLMLQYGALSWTCLPLLSAALPIFLPRLPLSSLLGSIQASRALPCHKSIRFSKTMRTSPGKLYQCVSKCVGACTNERGITATCARLAPAPLHPIVRVSLSLAGRLRQLRSSRLLVSIAEIVEIPSSGKLLLGYTKTYQNAI